MRPSGGSVSYATSASGPAWRSFTSSGAARDRHPGEGCSTVGNGRSAPDHHATPSLKFFLADRGEGEGHRFFVRSCLIVTIVCSLLLLRRTTAWRAPATQATVGKDVLTDTPHPLADPAFCEGVAPGLRQGFRRAVAQVS